MLAPPELPPLSLAVELPQEYEELIGLDKTFVRVCRSLDRLHGFSDSYEILAPYEHELPQDTSDFCRAIEDYDANRPVRVGEGGANLRTLLYLSYLEDTDAEFVKEGSLATRAIYDSSDMVTMPNSQLVLLDKETTQYLSARLTWDEEVVVPSTAIKGDFKLLTVADAIEHWYQRRQQGLPWVPRRDISLARQAASFLKTLQTGELDADYYPEQAEDFCFANAYGHITLEQGRARWQKLKGHESNRFESMETAIEQAISGQIIDVNDHRVVQAIAMRFGLGRVRFKYPDCVAKSWPRFWDFVDVARKQNGVYHWQPA